MTWKQKEFKAIWRGSSTGGDVGDAFCKYPGFNPGVTHFSQFHRQRMVGLCAKIDHCDAVFSSY